MSTQTQTLKLVGKPSYAHGSWPKNLGHSTHDPCSEKTVMKDLNSPTYCGIGHPENSKFQGRCIAEHYHLVIFKK